MTEDETGPNEEPTTVDAVVEPSIEAAEGRIGPEAAAEIQALGEVLAAIESCDLAAATGERAPSGDLVAAARRAAAEVASKLSGARTELGRARGQAARFLIAAEGLAEGAAAGVSATDGAVAALRQAGPRTEEVAEVVDHLEEVAAQAGVAALNVSVEVSRSESSGDQAVALLAEEVRRLADRGAAVARRLSAAVEGLRRAWADAARDLESSRLGQQGAADRAVEAQAIASELAASFDETTRAIRAIRLPEDARADEAAARLLEVEDSLGSALEGLACGKGAMPDGVADSLARLERRLRELREQRS